MPALRRVKQALMGIGLLTVLAVAAFAAVLAYIWWDSRSADDEFSVDEEFDDRDAAEFDDAGEGEFDADADEATEPDETEPAPD